MAEVKNKPNTEEAAVLTENEINEQMQVRIDKMHKIEECVHCDACKSRCPYGLDTPALLQLMLKDYDEFYAVHHNDK